MSPLTTEQPCRICGDSEPFHVHYRGERIEGYFTVGRGQTGFQAAQAWQRRALAAEADLAKAREITDAAQRFIAATKSVEHGETLAALADLKLALGQDLPRSLKREADASTLDTSDCGQEEHDEDSVTWRTHR